MAQFQPPPNLSLQGNLAENWKCWSQRFELFSVASGVSEKSEKVQCATFLHVAGEEAIKVCNTFVFADAEKDKIAVLKSKFKEYCEPRKNLTYIRHVFFTRAQKQSEPIDSYVTDLKSKAKDCEFGDLHDSLVRDRIVCGITNDQVRGRLLREADLTLEKAVDICRASELTNTQVKALTEEVEMNAVKTVKKKDFRVKANAEQQTEASCNRCGFKHGANACPALGQICKKCQKKNHFAKMCRSQSQSGSWKKQQQYRRRMHAVVQSEEEDDMFIGTLRVEQDKYISIMESAETETEKEKWTESLRINNNVVTFKLDTGADCNAMSIKTFNALEVRGRLNASKSKLVAFFGQKIAPLGKRALTCEHKGQKHRIEFEITQEDVPAILGGDTCVKLGLLKRMHEILKEDDILKDYEDLFDGLGCIPGQHHIQIDHTVTPVVHAPRRVPVAIRDRVVEELHRMVKMGVITRQTEPTDWVNSMVTVVTPKKIRICIDPKDLNEAIKREHYPLLTVEEVVSRMPNAKYFSVLDANKGFWQIRLDEESSKLCTFNTPLGRYRFLRLPFGISSASEVFQRAIAQMIEGLEGVVNIIDDLLVWGDSVAQHDHRLRLLLQRAKENNLKLNRDKCKIRTTEIKYIGHKLSASGLKPDEEKVRAVTELPPPQDKQELMRFNGMIQYLAKFIPNLSEVNAPLRKLLEDDTEWHWEEPQKRSFETLKKLVTSAPTLKFYDVNKPVTLSVDASSEGIGAVLLQEGQPVAYGSRALSDCQRRYAQIEKELFAIVYGCEKFHQYVYGKEIQVESDHKPLESIFKKPLHQAPMRLQRMLLRLQRYSLKVKYRPGKELHIADALSRAYLNEQKEELLEKDLEVNSVTLQLPVSEEKLHKFRSASAEDPEMQLLKNIILRGWPKERSAVPKLIQPYWTFRDEITHADGLMFKAAKLIVPNQMRQEMLNKIHESHLGIVKCKARARDILYWPHMSAQIEELVSQCATCQEHQNSNPREPLISHPVPERPWEKVGTDIFHFKGSDFLLCVDYFSKFPEIVKLKNTTSSSVIVALKSIFSRHGICDHLLSDNGPAYASVEFKDFVNDWEFKHSTSSPGHAQGNGQSERAIQSIKKLLKKAEDSNGDPYISLLEYRNTPLEGVGLSPAQLFMGRRLRGKLPTATSLLTPQGSDQVHSRLKERQECQKFYFDRHTKNLPDLQAGDNVRVQRGEAWQPAVVLQKHEHPRSFVIRTPEGKQYRRNRKHLRKTREETFPETKEQQDIDLNTNSWAKDYGTSFRHATPTRSPETPPPKNEVVSVPLKAAVEHSEPLAYQTRSGRQSKPPIRYGY
ncbi:uncharacterized protein K02A2.6-like [Xyrichtys novacula]|uniref:Gypsy retrotransposon integrase-like protein 1 n=1 Tax=Xyrichtys novacula TaxID=13765 RepID=A0AAV1EKY1_XYRNO|nr:uncharacterized protein K02A2.6-like [Xyrichtys novacula]